MGDQVTSDDKQQKAMALGDGSPVGTALRPRAWRDQWSMDQGDQGEVELTSHQ